MSRADSRSLDAQPLQRVDLKELCETRLEVYLDAAFLKRIALGLEVQAVRVSRYEWLLREPLCNLLDNAAKCTPDGSTVTLRCGRTVADGMPFMVVEDDGPGVPGNATEGSGLGLAIAGEIARVHRSRLIVDSGAAGRGMRITLLFAA